MVSASQDYKAPFDYRLIILAPALAVLDGRRSAELVLEVLKLPGHFDGWDRVSALEGLLSAGVRLTLDDVVNSIGPTDDPQISQLISVSSCD